MQIVLLRGINVGGHNKLPMADFKDILTELGARDVQTYIQSGNAVMQGDITTVAISDVIEKSKGFRPQVMVLPLRIFTQIANACPFPTDDGKALHIWFLLDKPDFDTAKADALAIPSESYLVTDQAVYLQPPVTGTPCASCWTWQTPDTGLCAAHDKNNRSRPLPFHPLCGPVSYTRSFAELM